MPSSPSRRGPGRLGRNQFDIGARQVPRQGVGMNSDAIRHRRWAHVDLVGSNLPGAVEAIAGGVFTWVPRATSTACPRTSTVPPCPGPFNALADKAPPTMTLPSGPPSGTIRPFLPRAAGLDGTLGVHHRVEQRIGGPGRHQDSPPSALSRPPLLASALATPASARMSSSLLPSKFSVRSLPAPARHAHLRQDVRGCRPARPAGRCCRLPPR